MDIVFQHRSQRNYSSCYQLKQNKLFPIENTVSWDVPAHKIHKIASGRINISRFRGQYAASLFKLLDDQNPSGKHKPSPATRYMKGTLLHLWSFLGARCFVSKAGYCRPAQLSV